VRQRIRADVRRTVRHVFATILGRYGPSAPGQWSPGHAPSPSTLLERRRGDVQVEVRGTTNNREAILCTGGPGFQLTDQLET
jgi:hypothetical protein